MLICLFLFSIIFWLSFFCLPKKLYFLLTWILVNFALQLWPIHSACIQLDWDYSGKFLVVLQAGSNRLVLWSMNSDKISYIDAAKEITYVAWSKNSSTVSQSNSFPLSFTPSLSLFQKFFYFYFLFYIYSNENKVVSVLTNEVL